jgi:hypothetical protein
LFSVDLDEDFVDIEVIDITAMPLLQAARVDSFNLDAPEAEEFVADGDASLGQKILHT